MHRSGVDAVLLGRVEEDGGGDHLVVRTGAAVDFSVCAAGNVELGFGPDAVRADDFALGFDDARLIGRHHAGVLHAAGGGVRAGNDRRVAVGVVVGEAEGVAQLMRSGAGKRRRDLRHLSGAGGHAGEFVEGAGEVSGGDLGDLAGGDVGWIDRGDSQGAETGVVFTEGDDIVRGRGRRREEGDVVACVDGRELREDIGLDGGSFGRVEIGDGGGGFVQLLDPVHTVAPRAAGAVVNVAGEIDEDFDLRLRDGP